MEDEELNRLILGLMAGGERADCPKSSFESYAQKIPMSEKKRGLIDRHIAKCKACRRELAFFETLQDPGKSTKTEEEFLAVDEGLEALHPDLIKRIETLNEGREQERFYKLTTSIIEDVYPRDLEEWESYWQNTFECKPFDQIIEETSEISKHKNLRRKGKYLEIAAGVGAIWNDLKENKYLSSKTESGLRGRLRKSGMSGEESNRIIEYIEKNANEYPSKE